MPWLMNRLRPPPRDCFDDDPHYHYKLEWLARLREAARSWLGTDAALVGDFNIAPRDEDVFDIAAYAHDTHVTPPERTSPHRG